MMRRAAGFTLLEVLVALVILALALGALIKTAGDHALLVADLETRTQAFLVAENQLRRLQASKLWPEGSEQSERGGCFISEFQRVDFEVPAQARGRFLCIQRLAPAGEETLQGAT